MTYLQIYDVSYNGSKSWEFINYLEYPNVGVGGVDLITAKKHKFDCELYTWLRKMNLDNLRLQYMTPIDSEELICFFRKVLGPKCEIVTDYD